MLEILKIIDEMDASINSHGGSKETLITLDDEEQRILTTDTILRASGVASEDVDETIKAKYLARLIKEYRKNRERAK